MPPREFNTLIDLIEGTRHARSDKGIRLVSPRFEESFHSYPELFRRILFHAEHLREQGIEQGDRVVVPLTTQIDVIGSFLALIWLGAVPVSVSGQMAGQDAAAYANHIKSLIERCRFDRLLLDSLMAEAFAGNVRFDPRIMVDPYPERIDPDLEPPDVPPAQPKADDVAFIQFSSGSTSRPKGIQITHRNICSNLEIIVANDGRTEDSVVVSWLPLYHDMGLVGCFLTPFVHYHLLVLMHPVCFLMKPVSWLDYTSRYRGTMTAIPNFAVDTCNTRIRDHQLEARRPDLSSLEYVYNGSEPVSAEAIEQFYRRFAPYGVRPGVIYPVYGMAEATLMVTAPRKGESLQVRQVEDTSVVSVGRPCGDFLVRIVDERGAPLPAGSVGEILIQGDSVSPGYFENDVENRERFRDGWFHTGDLGLLDDDGKLFVTGRIKDLIIVNGRNFYAHDLAAKVEELPFVKRGKTHVFSLEMEGREEVIVMTVLNARMTKDVRGQVQKLKEFLSQEPGSWFVKRLGEKTESFVQDMNPRDVSFLKEGIKGYLLREFGIPVHDVFLAPSIPKTTSGKVRRGECESLYLEHIKAQSRN